jgi:pimeloyl-ACP methyl ester carboxylesterase
MLETRHEQVDGHRVRVARIGSGPPLVLLHGYPDNLQIWCELAPRLARKFEVIAFDWPGLGQSEPWKGGMTPFHLADRLRALLDAWHIDRVHVAGADMGGQPALALAARHPERVQSITVMNSLVMWDEKTSWEIAILRKFGWNRLVLGRLPGAVFRRCERTFLPRGQRLTPELRDDLWSCFKRPDVRAAIIRMCAGYEGSLPRLAGEYARISVPMHVLWGGDDKHFPPTHAAKLHALVPGSKLEILDRAGHWMMWDRAEDVADRLLSFLA